MSMTVGIAVPAGRSRNSVLDSAVRQAIVNRHFGQITAENIMKPSRIHPAEGIFFFDHADALVEFAAGDIVVSWDVVNEAIADTDNNGDGLNDLRNTIWYENIGVGYLAAAFRAWSLAGI
jgi:endo-1,4-beta-xylanase